MYEYRPIQVSVGYFQRWGVPRQPVGRPRPRPRPPIGFPQLPIMPTPIVGGSPVGGTPTGRTRCVGNTLLCEWEVCQGSPALQQSVCHYVWEACGSCINDEGDGGVIYL